MGRAQEYNNFELIIYKANQEFLNESKPDGESKMAITNQTEAPHPTAKKNIKVSLGGGGLGICGFGHLLDQFCPLLQFAGFPFFSIWFSVFAKYTSSFFGFGNHCGFGFFPFGFWFLNCALQPCPKTLLRRYSKPLDGFKFKTQV